MVCYTSCALASGFLIASAYIMLTSAPKGDEFLSILSEPQKLIYLDIVKQRMKIYGIASISGLVLGLIYLFLMRNKIESRSALICSSIVVFFIVQMLVYTVYPNKDSMLNHISDGPNGAQQAKMWLKQYNQMMNKFLIGFAIGVIGYGILCFALTK
jgi:hypothetical protein